MADTESDLIRSSIELLILKALTWGPMHGYAISEWVETATSERLLLEEGTLYPALHRLEARRLIEGAWGVSENNRRAKYYKLLPPGRARFRAESSVWQRNAQAIAAALRATSPALS